MATTNYYDAAGEGRGYISGVATWAAAHDTADAQGVTGHLNIYGTKVNDANWVISRGFLPFDTSALPDDAEITAATLYLYRDDSTGEAMASADAADLDLVQSSQASGTELVVGDYDTLGTTVTGSKVLSATSDLTYFSIVLDATGLTWISKTGYTKLGIRISRDTDNSAPTGNNVICCQTRGAANPPYLAVTYKDKGGSFLLNFL